MISKIGAGIESRNPFSTDWNDNVLRYRAIETILHRPDEIPIQPRLLEGKSEKYKLFPKPRITNSTLCNGPMAFVFADFLLNPFFWGVVNCQGYNNF